MEGREILPGGVELIKCIYPNEGEALRRDRGVGTEGQWNRGVGGARPSNLGVWRPLPLCSTAYGGGGREGGRREGGHRLIISVSWLRP